jgi:hypothetical protein
MTYSVIQILFRFLGQRVRAIFTLLPFMTVRHSITCIISEIDTWIRYDTFRTFRQSLSAFPFFDSIYLCVLCLSIRCMSFCWILIPLQMFDLEVCRLHIVGQPADTVAGGLAVLFLHFPAVSGELGPLDTWLPHKLVQPEYRCTFWIRGSTGRICTDFIQSSNLPALVVNIPAMQDVFPFNAAYTEPIIIDSLKLEQYHRIIYWNLGHPRTISTSASVIVNLGAIILCPSNNQLEDTTQISFFNPRIQWGRWATIQGIEGEITEDGWTRY